MAVCMHSVDVRRLDDTKKIQPLSKDNYVSCSYRLP